MALADVAEEYESAMQMFPVRWLCVGLSHVPSRLSYFRLLEEKDNKHINADISGRITSVQSEDEEEIGFQIPADNPAAYSFVPNSILSHAALR